LQRQEDAEAKKKEADKISGRSLGRRVTMYKHTGFAFA